MAGIRWKAERLRLKDLVAKRDGRILVAIGVANGAEARQLHHTIYELYDQNAVPDFIGGFITFVSGYLCAAEHGLPTWVISFGRRLSARPTSLSSRPGWRLSIREGPPFRSVWMWTPGMGMNLLLLY